jgi:hypothetical protein
LDDVCRKPEEGVLGWGGWKRGQVVAGLVGEALGGPPGIADPAGLLHQGHDRV